MPCFRSKTGGSGGAELEKGGERQSQGLAVAALPNHRTQGRGVEGRGEWCNNTILKATETGAGILNPKEGQSPLLGVNR